MTLRELINVVTFRNNVSIFALEESGETDWYWECVYSYSGWRTEDRIHDFQYLEDKYLSWEVQSIESAPERNNPDDDDESGDVRIYIAEELVSFIEHAK